MFDSQGDVFSWFRIPNSGPEHSTRGTISHTKSRVERPYTLEINGPGLNGAIAMTRADLDALVDACVDVLIDTETSPKGKAPRKA